MEWPGIFWPQASPRPNMTLPRAKHHRGGAGRGRADDRHSGGSDLHGVTRKLRALVFSSHFFWISPADAAALSLALRALTAGKAFFGVAKSSVHEPTRASVRPARAIFLYSEGQSWPALSTTIPLCCNYCRSIARLPVRVFPEVYSLYCDSVTHAAELFLGYLA